MAASVDLASKDRFTLGVGIGGFKRDFEVARVSWKKRAKIRDETLAVSRRLLSGESVTYSGEFYAFDEYRAEPRPMQQLLPIWVRADGTNAIAEGVIQRTAIYGDGIISFATSAATYDDARSRIIRSAIDLGRSPSEFTWSNCLF